MYSRCIPRWLIDDVLSLQVNGPWKADGKIQKNRVIGQRKKMSLKVRVGCE